MSTPMTAPNNSNGGGRTKRNDIAIVPKGLHPVVLYGIVDLGTQEKNYQGNVSYSRTIKFIFEFPLFKQFFFEDDTEQKPTVLSLEFPFFIYKTKNNKKTGLLQFIESIYGPLSPNQYDSFDVSQMLGKLYLANVVHNVSNSNNNTYANIQSIIPYTEQYFANEYQNGLLNRTNDLVLFSLNHGFQGTQFASLSYYDRSKIKSSSEAIEYANTGGQFSKFDENKNLVFESSQGNNQQQQPQQQQQQYQQAPQQQTTQNNNRQQPAGPPGPGAPGQVKKLVMLVNDFTLQEYKKAGWTEDGLIQSGKAKWEENKPAAPQGPAGPPAPQAPAQAPAAAPQQQTYQAPPAQQTNNNAPMSTPNPQGAPVNANAGQPQNYSQQFMNNANNNPAAMPKQQSPQNNNQGYQPPILNEEDYNPEAHDDLPF